MIVGPTFDLCVQEPLIEKAEIEANVTATRN